MKRFFMLPFFLLLTITSSAQEKKGEMQNKWGIGLQVNTIEKLPTLGAGAILDERYILGAIEKDKSYSMGIVGIRKVNDNIYCKLNVAYTNRNIRETSSPVNPKGNYVISTATISQSFFRIFPGIFWTIQQNKINFFGGFNIPLSFYKEIKIAGHTDSYSADTLSYIEDDALKIPKGISVGLGSFLGFSISLSRHFSLGSEISFAYLFSRMGYGETELVVSGKTPGGITQVTTTKSNDSIQKAGIFNLQGSMNVFYYF